MNRWSKHIKRRKKRKMWIEGEDLDCIVDMYDVTCIEGQETARMSKLIERIKKVGR